MIFSNLTKRLNSNPTYIRAKYLFENVSPPHYAVLIGLCALSLFFAPSSERQSQPLQHKKEANAISTMLPKGTSLIPIPIQNPEALSQMIGQYGVVDLYRSFRESNVEPTLLARSIRILRSPLNPHQFAVLAPPSEAHRLIGGNYQFFVVIRKSEDQPTQFVKPNKKKRKIIFTKIQSASY